MWTVRSGGTEVTSRDQNGSERKYFRFYDLEVGAAWLIDIELG